ncbi:MAG: aspartate kinase [candidate division KSB1 bacterium]|jgi:aspartokinase/homoserine dehydrogenase 1|nr:aspartate kinase [candidate division KSB1 bacterium]
MKILKFGGSSIASPANIFHVKTIIDKYLHENEKIACVFPAFEGVTDALMSMSVSAESREDSYEIELKALEKRHLEVVSELIDISGQSRIKANVIYAFNELEDILHGVYLVQELTLKTTDFILSFGERLSANIITEFLRQHYNPVDVLDTRGLIITDESYTSANVILDDTCRNIESYFKEHHALQIITGFLGATQKGDTTTLGRGGSDYTAAIFGASLNASEIHLYTDVDGVMTADPKKVDSAFLIESMSYDEAMEMSHFGAKVIYAPTIQPALERSIPIRIMNVFRPELHGTLISDMPHKGKEFPICGISSIDEIALIRIQGSGMVGVVGIAGRLFSVLAREKINVILITQASSEHTICFAIDINEAERARTCLEDEFKLEMKARQIDAISVEDTLSIIAVVGENMRHTPGIAAKLFSALGSKGINVVAIAQGSSELNISLVVDRKNQTAALNAIHESFFSNEI